VTVELAWDFCCVVSCKSEIIRRKSYVKIEILIILMTVWILLNQRKLRKMF
jgi:hypothetical protein